MRFRVLAIIFFGLSFVIVDYFRAKVFDVKLFIPFHSQETQKRAYFSTVNSKTLDFLFQIDEELHSDFVEMNPLALKGWNDIQEEGCPFIVKFLAKKMIDNKIPKIIWDHVDYKNNFSCVINDEYNRFSKNYTVINNWADFLVKYQYKINTEPSVYSVDGLMNFVTGPWIPHLRAAGLINISKICPEKFPERYNGYYIRSMEKIMKVDGDLGDLLKNCYNFSEKEKQVMEIKMSSYLAAMKAFNE